MPARRIVPDKVVDPCAGFFLAGDHSLGIVIEESETQNESRGLAGEREDRLTAGEEECLSRRLGHLADSAIHLPGVGDKAERQLGIGGVRPGLGVVTRRKAGLCDRG